MNRSIIVTAASLVIGTFGLVGCDRNQSASNTNSATGTTAGQKTADAIGNAGQKTGSALGNAIDRIGAATQPSADSAMKGTRKTLGDAVEDALTNNDFNKLVGEFTKADRDRIGKQSDDSLADLNAAVGQFRRDWKAKYNQDFKLTDKEEVVFGTPVSIQPGGGGVEANLASSTAVPDNTTASTAANKAASERANNITNVNIPKSDAAPAVTLTLQNEGSVMNDYKIDVPDSVDAATLKANLIKHINHIESMKDQWPSDVNEASRIVSQHILKAISESGTAGSASIR
jgi:hypothetical protein